MLWKLKWKIKRGTSTIAGSATGLRSLKECRDKLVSIRRSTLVVEAYAHPEFSGGRCSLFGAPTQRI